MTGKKEMCIANSEEFKKEKARETPYSTIPKRELLEPVENDGDFYWLTRTYRDAPDNRTMKEMAKDDTPIEKIAEYALEKPNQWQCRKCGAVIHTIKGEPNECYERQGGCGRVCSFDVVVPNVQTDLWKIPKWKYIEKLDMLKTYDDAMVVVKSTIVFVEEVLYKIFVLWAINTYKLNTWNYMGWPLFIGLPTSGKSKGLDILRELGWRLIPAVNCKFTAMVRASHLYGAGILLDEIEYKLSTKTERGQELLEFIKPSYRRGVKYCVADVNDPYGIVSYDNYSFKAFAGEILHDPAMKLRCIPFEMEKDTPKVEDITDIQDEMDRVQNIFYNYKYQTDDPPKLPKDCVLHGRIRENFEGIIRTGMHIGIDVNDIIEYAQRQEREQLLEFQNSVEREILQHIKNFQELKTVDDYSKEMLVTEIAERLGWNDTKERQRLGYMLRGKKIGLKTQHTRVGAVVRFTDGKTERKLKYLYKRYGITESNAGYSKEENNQSTNEDGEKKVDATLNGAEKVKEHSQRVNEIHSYVSRFVDGVSIVALNDNFKSSDISGLMESGQLIKLPNKKYVWYEKQ